MDSRKLSLFVAFFLSVNLIFSTIVSGCYTCTQPNPNPNPNPNPTPAPAKSCPRDALKLGVCAKLLGGAVGADAGSPTAVPCCSVLGGLLDLEAALCLCTALKAKILGINVDIPISLSLLIDTCGKQLPPEFKCA